MNFNEYQTKAYETEIYKGKADPIQYLLLGLHEEGGEIAGKVKKVLRDEKGVFSEKFKEDIKKELGDVLWYLSALAKEFGFDLNSIAEANIVKINSRKERDRLHGEGDDR
ncbi:MAG: nucleoside triphosphate pyrophosphohydrolase family protein [Desulfobacterales bacterium]|nr:nucleoside triphosphate pyrophosphohydrolase family protein [Desulfobacterales bacterium]